MFTCDHSAATDFTHEALRLFEEEPLMAENAHRLKDEKAHALLWHYICNVEKKLQEVSKCLCFVMINVVRMNKKYESFLVFNWIIGMRSIVLFSNCVFCVRLLTKIGNGESCASSSGVRPIQSKPMIWNLRASRRLRTATPSTRGCVLTWCQKVVQTFFFFCFAVLYCIQQFAESFPLSLKDAELTPLYFKSNAGLWRGQWTNGLLFCKVAKWTLSDIPNRHAAPLLSWQLSSNLWAR